MELGSKHTPEAIAKMVEAKRKYHGMRGKKHSALTKAKMSKKRQGENNPIYGKKRSPETIEKIRQSKLGKKMNKETRKYDGGGLDSIVKKP